MNSSAKILLSISLCAVLVVAGLSWTRGQAQTLSQPRAQQSSETMRTVQVSGSAESQVKPDVAVLRLGVQTQAKTAQAALDQNNTQMQALIDQLKQAKIASQNIQTQTIQLTPRYENDNRNNTQTLAGYTASNVVQVRTEDLESVGTVLDKAVNAGANTIESINFEVTNSEALLDQVREAAVQNARHKAEQLAKLAGATLGPIVEIQESSSVPSPVPAQAEVSAAAVPVLPGMQTVTVQVQMTWSLVLSNQP